MIVAVRECGPTRQRRSQGAGWRKSGTTPRCSIGRMGVAFRAWMPEGRLGRREAGREPGARTGVVPRQPRQSTAIYSPPLRAGCEIGLRAQGTRDQEAGPGLRPLAPPITATPYAQRSIDAVTARDVGPPALHPPVREPSSLTASANAGPAAEAERAVRRCQ